MTEAEYQTDYALADALAALRQARASLEVVCRAGIGPVCSALVGVLPALEEKTAQVKAAQREFEGRLGKGSLSLERDR